MNLQIQLVLDMHCNNLRVRQDRTFVCLKRQEVTVGLAGSHSVSRDIIATGICENLS